MSRLGTLYSTSDQMSRPPGVPCSSCSLRLTLTVALVVSTTGEAPVTVTVSASVATVSVMSSGVVWPVRTDEVLAHHRPEALQFDAHGVDTGRQRREAVDSAAVGDAGSKCRRRGPGC